MEFWSSNVAPLRTNMMNNTYLKYLIYSTFLVVVAKFLYHFYSAYTNQQLNSIKSILNGLVILLMIGFIFYYNNSKKDISQSNK